MASPLLLIGKQLIAKALLKKVEQEVTKRVNGAMALDKDENGEFKKAVETITVEKVSAKKASGWVFVATSFAYFASTQGWISPEVAGFINTLLSSPEVVDAVEGAIN